MIKKQFPKFIYKIKVIRGLRLRGKSFEPQVFEGLAFIQNYERTTKITSTPTA